MPSLYAARPVPAFISLAHVLSHAFPLSFLSHRRLGKQCKASDCCQESLDSLPHKSMRQIPVLLLLVLAFSSTSAQSTLRGSPGITKLEDKTKTDPMQSFALSTLTGEAEWSTEAEKGMTGRASTAAGDKQMAFSGGRPPFPVAAILNDPRGVAERSPSKDPLYPLCGWTQPILESEQYCAWVLATERASSAYSTVFRRSIVTQPTIYTSEKEPWQGNVALPVRLADLGDCLPIQVPGSIVRAEHHTYYW